MAIEVRIVLLLSVVVCAIVARHMAIRRGRSPNGWALSGALLGPLPLLVLAVLPRRKAA